ncbi:MAG TPA: rhombosortase [Burkholderiaceae bacterium]|jgi:rhomboid family GlyGly-CTERM serine protease|nr:rhombosortase [Burkholderiaceae bacterium]
MRAWVGPAERFALAGVAVVLLLQAAGLGPALEYRRALLASQPWRLLTCHLVHANWRHAAGNAAAWLALAWLLAPELPPARQALLLASSALATGLLLWLAAPDVAWYRGLSGALHGLAACAAVLWLARPGLAGGRTGRLWPALLLATVWIKVTAEQVGAAPLATENWVGVAVVTRAHLFGAATGTLIGASWAWLRRTR